jgi:hypothetical protein
MSSDSDGGRFIDLIDFAREMVAEDPLARLSATSVSKALGLNPREARKLCGQLVESGLARVVLQDVCQTCFRSNYAALDSDTAVSEGDAYCPRCGVKREHIRYVLFAPTDELKARARPKVRRRDHLARLALRLLRMRRSATVTSKSPRLFERSETSPELCVKACRRNNRQPVTLAS